MTIVQTETVLYFLRRKQKETPILNNAAVSNTSQTCFPAVSDDGHKTEVIFRFADPDAFDVDYVDYH